MRYRNRGNRERGLIGFAFYERHFWKAGKEKNRDWVLTLSDCCERKGCLLYAQIVRFESKPLALPFAKKNKKKQKKDLWISCLDMAGDIL